MARKIVDIGVEGNDGTGDSIREAFRKTNDNFKELYAVFGQDGTISFLDLGDTPNSYTNNANKITIVNSDGTGLEFKELIGTAGLEITYPTTGENAGKIVLDNKSTSLANDLSPQLGGALNARGQVIGYVGDPTPTAVAEFNSKYGYNGAAAITADQFAINRKYADSRYVNLNGDIMTGHLSVPAGAANNQVPRANETVLKAGSTMTGKLYLSDHPGELSGAGTPNGIEDLQAATKFYVDNTSYSSEVNIYVSTSGDDSQSKAPRGREGRHWSYAYRTLGAACLRAEQLIKDSPWELGPYRQRIAYNNGADFSEVQAVQPNRGLNGTLRIRFNNNQGRPVDQGVPENRDIMPGKMVVGTVSGARGFIVRYDTDGPQDYVDLRDVVGAFQVGENLEFDQAVKRLGIAIFIEAGTYYEDLPIKVPQNVSIIGDDFRTTVVKPADRPSRSPWAATWFYRDKKFDGLTIAETNWGYHYLTDPTNKASLPKNNKDLDVFLCNDATSIRQISCQGHGGFMMVFDPEGQILTKSPYVQQAGCFSASLNKQRFAGGQFVDGQAGSMPVSVVSMNAAKNEIIVSEAFRTPQTPTVFYVNGHRYKIDTFTDTGDGYHNASDLINSNRDFIIAETIAYVNDVITPTFTYDQVKCSRDIGYILNAVAWDVVFDSNVQTILASQAYFYKRNGDPYTLLPTQRQATIDALGHVKEQLQALFDGVNPTALTRVNALMDIVIDIVTNGLSAVPPRLMAAPPAPPLPATNTNIVNALNILLANREFIKAEYIAYCASAFGEDFAFGVDPETNQGAGVTGYQRDIDRMINSVIYDTVYGGNSQSSLVARGFYDVNGFLLISDDVNEIVQAIDYIKVVARDVTLNVSIDYKKQYTVPQVFGTPSTTLVANNVVSLFDNIKDIIVLGLSAGDAVTYPDATNASSGLKDAKNAIDGNALAIRSSTIEFINSRYLYDQLAAENDISFILDALVHDLVYTGDLKIVEHGLSYFVGDAPLVSDAERPRTLAIIDYLEQILMYVVSNTDVPGAGIVKRRQFEIPQIIQLNTDASSGPIIVDPNIAWVDASLVSAAQSIAASATSIRSNIISYLNTTYGTTYDRVKCERDIDKMIEALRYDVMFGSNFRSIKASAAYYYTLPTVSAATQKEVTLVAITQLKAQVASVVSNVILAKTRVEQNSDIMYSVVNNGVNAAPAFVLPNPPAYDLGYLNARRLITSNKSFIIAEITAWIAAQKEANITPFTSSYVYDVAAFERNIANTLDALQFDLSYTGNLETLSFANTFITDTINLVSDADRDETLAAYQYLSSIIDDIARGITISKSATNTLTQDVSGTGATADAAAYAQSRVNDVVDTIDIESVNSQPRVSELIGTVRTIVAGTTGFTDARDLLVANRDFIKAEVTNYIDYKYTVSVTGANSTTDLFTTASTANMRVGMPVEFIGLDPFSEEITNASDVSGTGPFFVTFEFARQRTAPAINVDYEILNNSNASYNVIAIATASTTNSITLQFTSDPGDWGVQTVSTIRVATGTFGGIIRGQKYYVKSIPNSTTFSVSATIQDGVPGAALQLVTATGNMKCTLSYDRATCARDVGFIVSNIATDLLYNGRYNSIRTGLRYWSNTAQKVIGEQQPETLDGIQFINTVAQRVIANQTVAFSYDQDVCRRDVGLIVDAVTSDTVFGTNYASITAGQSYLRSYAGVVTDTQKVQTIAALNQTKSQMLALTLNASTKTSISSLMDLIIQTIDLGSLPNGTTLTYGAPNNTSANVTNAAAVIRANKQFLIEEVIAFINVNLNPSQIPNYNEAICRRDTGVVIDALVYDLMYGGSKMSVRAANAYLSGILNVIAQEGTQTAAAFTRLQTAIGYVIVNSTNWSKSAGNTALQNTTLPAGTSAEVTVAQQLLVPVINVANSGNAQPDGAEPTYANGKNYSYAGPDRITVLNNVENIKTNVISFINTTYGASLTYQNLNGVAPEIKQVVIDSLTNGTDASSAVSSLVTVIYDIVESGPSAVPTGAIEYPKYVLQLNEETPYSETLSGTLPDTLIIQAAGNTSMLSNDWTQINDLGYGLIATNNGLIETVSVFTYYCWAAYYAHNGGQIRSVGGSNAHGEYGLIAEGSDPFKEPDYVNLSNDMVQVGSIYKAGPFSTEMERDNTVLYIDQYGYLPYNVSEIEINHGYGITADGSATSIGVTRYEVSNISDVSSTVFLASAVTFTSKTAVSGGYNVVLTFPAKVFAPDVGRTFTVSGNSNSNYNGNFACVAATTSSITLRYTTDPGTFGTGTTAVKLKSGSILRVNLNTGGNNNTSTSGLQKGLTHGQLITIRSNQNFKFYNVDKVNPTRPSTALTFRGDPYDDEFAPVYRVLAFNTRDPLSNALVVDDPVIKNEVILTFDSSYDYIEMAVAQARTTITELAAGIEGGSSTRTLGSKAGDKFIAIEKITSSRDLARIQTGEMVISWNGRVHRVVSYTLKQISSVESYGILELSEQRVGNGAYQSIVTTPATGITAPVKSGVGFTVTNAVYSAGYVTFNIPLQDTIPANGSYTVYGNSNTAYNITATSTGNTTSTIRLPFAADPGVFGTSSVTRIFPASTIYNPELVDGDVVTLKAGLSKGENADIIVNISTCRATSHDFLDIGSGSYNQTNYPSKVYGSGRQKSQKKEVVERTTGRVFWVSTDQDGFFRVGRFFTVDQGTGTVSFAASLALSNLDGLGFKRGRTISEFSDDDTFQDLAQDSVPTEGATDGYINRRLGIDREGTVISEGTLGPGFLDRAGILPATGNINLGNNRLVNVASPASGTDAVNRNYVDAQEFSDVRVNASGRQDNDILTWNAETNRWVNAKTSSANSQVQVDLVGEKELNVYVKRETINDSQISSAANIGQSKLAINSATAQRDRGVKISSVATSTRLQVSSVTVTGNSPNILVKFKFTTSLSTAPVTGIYYTIQGSTNTSYNGTYYCVASGTGLDSSVTLMFAEHPGEFTTETVTYATAHVTEVTTQLPHGIASDDTVAISGITGNTVLNKNYSVLSVPSTTKFTVQENTYNATITVTNGRVTKLGLSTFNKNQFDVTDGFVSVRGSGSATFTANIAANSAVITNISSMDNISVGSVITLQANFGSVAMPATTAGSTPTAISQQLPVTVVSIDSATQITVSRAFAGSGSATNATLNVVYGIPLNSVQQIPTDRIVGNLSGSTTSPSIVTTSEIVEAGDGIKNVEFNGANRIGYSNNNTTVLPDSSTDLNIHGLMTLRAIGTNSWQNTYGVFKVTRTGEANSIVRTNAAGEIEATAYVLDGKLAFDSSGSANIDMYTPGGAKFLTATGTTLSPAALTVNLGVANESGVLSGTVTVPKFIATGTITMNPSNASISLQPTGTGTIVVNPSTVGSIDNMSIGSTTRSSGKFTSLAASDVVAFTNTSESSTTGTGALVVSGGLGVAKNINVGGNAVIAGNLTVNGITTSINSANLVVDDKNIELASVGTISPLSGTIDSAGVITNIVDSLGNAPSGLITGMVLSKISGTGAFGTSPIIGTVNSQNSITVSITSGTFTAGTITFSAAGNNDTTADGGGITVKGTTDKTLTWVNATNRWTANVGFEATSIQNTPIGNTTSSSGAFTTLTANGATTLTANVDATSATAGGTLTVTGGAAVSKKLFVGDTAAIAGKTTISNTTNAAYTGTGPYTFSDGALRVQGGAVVEKNLVVFGSSVLLGDVTVDGTINGTFNGVASQTSTVNTATASAFYLTFVNSNNATAAGETFYTGAGLTFNPSTNTLATTTFNGNLIGNVTGQATGADTVKTVNANNVADSTYYLTFVADDNAVGSAANESLYTDVSLAFNPSTNTVFASAFNGALIGNADTATQVKTVDASNSNATHYIAFVNSNNTTATAETVYTDSGITVNPSTDTIAATTFTGTLVGAHKGNVTLDDGTAVLTRGATASASTFAGNAATASKWATGRSITLTGAVTGTIASVDGSANITIDTTIGTSTASPNSDKVKVTANTATDSTYYLLFANGADGTYRDVNADNGAGGPQYNPSTNTLSCDVFSGTATAARYADLAENYLADNAYEPGTVVVFGGENEVTISTIHNDRRVAGVVSTNPAHLMNADLVGDTVVALALQGRVPCKVVGPVAKGDILVTSAKPGYAIVNNNPNVGTVIGKAVGAKTTLGDGIVEVVVGRL